MQSGCNDGALNLPDLLIPPFQSPCSVNGSAPPVSVCENSGAIFQRLEFYGLVIHYSTGGNGVACGRNNHNLSCTADSDRVTCKSCQRSLAKLVPPPAPVSDEDGPGPSYVSPSKQCNVSGFCFNANWRVYLEALPNRCRLPRGAPSQIFV